MRSPAPAIESNRSRPPRSTVSPRLSAWPSTSGSAAGYPEVRKRVRSPNARSNRGPRSNCSSARTARSTSTYRSRPLLPMALEEFESKKKPNKVALRQLLRP